MYAAPFTDHLRNFAKTQFAAAMNRSSRTRELLNLSRMYQCKA
jgi:hypothetical protein